MSTHAIAAMNSVTVFQCTFKLHTALTSLPHATLTQSLLTLCLSSKTKRVCIQLIVLHSIQHYIDLWCYLICFYCIFSSGRGNTLKQLQCFCLCQVVQSDRLGFYIHGDLESRILTVCACLIPSCCRHQNTAMDKGQLLANMSTKVTLCFLKAIFFTNISIKFNCFIDQLYLLACASNNVLESCVGLLSTFSRIYYLDNG
jgi:histone deacetylase complex regulatory component SIN3